MSANPFSAAKAAVVLVDPAARRRTPEVNLRRAFQLTGAEARLAAHLATGDALEVVCDRIGVSKETGRNQRKGIFAKTGDNRQVELVLLLSSMRQLHLPLHHAGRECPSRIRASPMRYAPSHNPFRTRSWESFFDSAPIARDLAQFCSIKVERGSTMVRLLITLALVSIVPQATLAEEGKFSSPLGGYSCLRSIACRDRCLTRYDARCAQGCKPFLMLCQAHRAKDALIYKAALIGRAAAKFSREREMQHPISEARPITRVGALLEKCESHEPLEREECANLVGAWGIVMIRNGGRREADANERRPGAACATTASSISDADFSEAFIAWARKYPSKRDLDVYAGLDAAIAAAWPCPGTIAE
ncbi:helix-turn-helix transcriptional regulator [Bradyrhizobium sp. USDA 4473]